MPPLVVSLLQRVLRAVSLRAEAGQTGVEVALAGCVCAATLGAAVIAASGDASQQFSSLFHTNLMRVSGTLALRGDVIATASGQPARVDGVQLVVEVIGDGNVALQGEGADRLIVGYRDGGVSLPDVPYVAKEIAGDGDGRLEAGETALISVPAASLASLAGSSVFAAGSSWTLTLQAPFGVALNLTRSTPTSLNGVNDLE